MKNFWVFAGDDYYPYRALGNFKGVYNSREEAELAGKSYGYDWYRVVEVENNEPVLEDDLK